MYRYEQRRRRSLLRLIVATGAVAAVVAATVLFAPGAPYRTLVIPWFLPATSTVLFVIAISVAFLAFGRYQVTWNTPSFWVGIGSSGFAIAMIFNMLTFPGLLQQGRQILGRMPNTAVWEGSIALSWVALALLLATLLQWPRESAVGPVGWRWSIVWWLLGVVALHVVFVLYEGDLPVMIAPDGSFTTLFRLTNGASLGAVSLIGAACSFRRFSRTGDGMTGYVAICQLSLLAVALLSFVEAGRWDVFWFIQRFLWLGGFLIMFFGLLSEYTNLFRIEEEKTRELAATTEELKQSEEQLRKSEATLRLAIEATGLGTFDFDPRTGELIWSEQAKENFGLSPEAPSNYDVFLSAVHPEDRERARWTLQQALKPGSGGVYSGEYRTIGIEDGKERWLIARGHVFFGNDGEPVRLVGATLDITEPKKAEEELRKARDYLEERVQERTEELTRALQELEKEAEERVRAVDELRVREQLLMQQNRLAAMGEMLVNISHQWRQPLNVVGLLLQNLITYYDLGKLSREYLESKVNRGIELIEQMSATIDDFTNYLRPDRVKAPFTLQNAVEKAVSMVRETMLGIEVRIDAAAAPPAVSGYRNDYVQVLINILMNARDALQERGSRDGKIIIRIFSDNGNGVVTIADNAGGVPGAVMEKIFQPYFTTKAPGKGTGIGLFMAKSIIEKGMGGKLTVRNTAEGAEFRIEVAHES